MKLLLSVLICLFSISAFAQQSSESLGREFVKGLAQQKNFESMGIFFNEDDFNLLIDELKASPKVKEDVKKSLDDPKEIETSRKEFLKDRAKLQQKWEEALEIIKDEKLSVIYEKVETIIDDTDGFKVNKIKIFFNIKKGEEIYSNTAKVDGIIVGGRLKVAILKSFDIQYKETEKE